ncbi:ATP-binding protein [Paludibacterium yongneupense]|uniref:ATP-binding protein n=1 Tax=Paludibacterium yongneupense TaxID=400061 RepID=UPI0003F7873F|nr:ATP-binding protein [Paludibacterium yongneupense]
MNPALASDLPRALARVRSLRSGMLLVALCALAVCAAAGVELAWLPLIQAWTVLAVLNLLLSRLSRRGVSPGGLLAASLCADVLTLAEMLAYSGGAANPLASLFLPPVLLASLLCPAAFAWSLCLATLALYALLFGWHLPWPLMGRDIVSGASFHLIGMWLTFAVSALLLTAFITRLSRQLARSEAEQREARAASLRDEAWLTIGLQAASAAHSLSTPLNTLTLLVDDWLRQNAVVPGLNEDLALMRRQLELCREALLRLRQGAERDEAPVAVIDVLNQRLLAWSSLHPKRRLVSASPQEDRHVARLPAAFWPALYNLLNNAAEAGDGMVDVAIAWQGDALQIDIVNHEGKLSDAQCLRAGQLPLSSDKAAGMGIGLMLAQAALTRLGGTLELGNRIEGGVCARLLLSLEHEEPR